MLNDCKRSFELFKNIILIFSLILFATKANSDAEFKPIVNDSKSYESLLKFQEGCEDVQSILELVRFFDAAITASPPNKDGGESKFATDLKEQKKTIFETCQLISMVLTASTGRDLLNLARVAGEKDDRFRVANLDKIESSISMVEFGQALSKQWQNADARNRKRMLLNTSNWGRLFNYTETIGWKADNQTKANQVAERQAVVKRLQELNMPLYTGCKVPNATFDELKLDHTIVDEGRYKKLIDTVAKARKDTVFNYNSIKQIEDVLVTMFSTIDQDNYESNVYVLNRLKNDYYSLQMLWDPPESTAYIPSSVFKRKLTKKEIEADELAKKNGLDPSKLKTTLTCEPKRKSDKEGGGLMYESNGVIKLTCKSETGRSFTEINQFAVYKDQGDKCKGGMCPCKTEQSDKVRYDWMNRLSDKDFINNIGNTGYLNSTFANSLKLCENFGLKSEVNTIADTGVILEEIRRAKEVAMQQSIEDMCNDNSLKEFKKEMEESSDLRPSTYNYRYKKGKKDSCKKPADVSAIKVYKKSKENKTLSDWIEGLNEAFAAYITSAYKVEVKSAPSKPGTTSSQNQAAVNDATDNKENNTINKKAEDIFEDQSPSTVLNSTLYYASFGIDANNDYKNAREYYESRQGINENQRRFNDKFIKFSLCNIPDVLIERYPNEAKAFFTTDPTTSGGNTDIFKEYENLTLKETARYEDLEVLVSKCKYEEMSGGLNHDLLKIYVNALMRAQKKYMTAYKVIVAGDILTGAYRDSRDGKLSSACADGGEIKPLDSSLIIGKAVVALAELESLKFNMEQEERSKKEKEEEMKKLESSKAKAEAEKQRQANNAKKIRVKLPPCGNNCTNIKKVNESLQMEKGNGFK